MKHLTTYFTIAVILAAVIIAWNWEKIRSKLMTDPDSKKNTGNNPGTATTTGGGTSTGAGTSNTRPSNAPAISLPAGIRVSGSYTSTPLNRGLIIKKGSKGNEVRYLQEMLYSKWHNQGLPAPAYGVDGDFGGETETWLRTVTLAYGSEKYSTTISAFEEQFYSQPTKKIYTPSPVNPNYSNNATPESTAWWKKFLGI